MMLSSSKLNQDIQTEVNKIWKTIKTESKTLEKRARKIKLKLIGYYNLPIKINLLF